MKSHRQEHTSDFHPHDYADHCDRDGDDHGRGHGHSGALRGGLRSDAG